MYSIQEKVEQKQATIPHLSSLGDHFYEGIVCIRFTHSPLPSFGPLVRNSFTQSKPCKFALIHSDRISPRGNSLSRDILTVFARAVEIGGSDVGLTGRTAFPLRQMEKETRLMEEGWREENGESGLNGRHLSNR